jgi:hypothetical protein
VTIKVGDRIRSTVTYPSGSRAGIEGTVCKVYAGDSVDATMDELDGNSWCYHKNEYELVVSQDLHDDHVGTKLPVFHAVLLQERTTLSKRIDAINALLREYA